MSTKICGIDIGTFSIKVARLEINNKSFNIYAYHEYPLSLDPNRDRQIELIEIFRAIRAVESGTDIRYSVSLPQSLISSRLKTFPFRERHKILRATPFEVEDDIPLDQDESIFDAKIARFKGASADVLCMVAPKESIDFVLRSVREGGIDPIVVSAEASAYANTVEDWAAGPPSLSAAEEFNADLNSPELGLTSPVEVYLHFGHSSSVLTVYQNQRMVGSRSLQWGSRVIAESIARKQQIPVTEAIRLLHSKGYILLQQKGATKEQAAFSGVITESLRSFVSELRLSLLEIKSDLNATITQMYISGGAAQIPNMGAYLTQMTEVATNTYNHLNRYSSLHIDQTGSAPYCSNIAIGLAIEGAKRPRNPAVNFRKGEFAGEGQSWQSFWNKWRRTAQIAATALVVIFIYSVLREEFAKSLSIQAETTLKDQAKNLLNLKGSKASESNIRKFISEKEKEAKVREMLQEIKGLSSGMDVLRRFNDLIPRKEQVQLDLKQWSLQRDQLIVQGLVAAPPQVEMLRKALESLSSDMKVQAVPAKVPAAAGKTAFAFQLKVTRNQQK